MVYIIVIAIGMVVGVLFALEVVKMMKEHAGMLTVAVMIAWDGVWIYMCSDYVTKKELAIGIMLGTLLKAIVLIKNQNKLCKN